MYSAQVVDYHRRPLPSSPRDEADRGAGRGAYLQSQQQLKQQQQQQQQQVSFASGGAGGGRNSYPTSSSFRRVNPEDPYASVYGTKGGAKRGSTSSTYSYSSSGGGVSTCMCSPEAYEGEVGGQVIIFSRSRSDRCVDIESLFSLHGTRGRENKSRIP